MDTRDITKHYKKGDLTIAWKSGLCIHSGICFRGLPDVFDPRVQPWIRPDRATDEQIIEQIKKCPSGAISIV